MEKYNADQLKQSPEQNERLGGNKDRSTKPKEVRDNICSQEHQDAHLTADQLLQKAKELKENIICIRCRNKTKQRKTKTGKLSLYCLNCSKETKMEIIE